MAQKRKKNKKWLFWVLIVVLFVVAAAVCYLVWDGYFRDKKEESSVEEQSLVEEVKEKPEDTEEVEAVVEKEKVVQYEGEDPNEQDELTGVVTYASVNGDNLMIRVNIDQYLEDGSCELSLVKNGSSMYTDVAGVINAAATATCEGFNVPAGGLSGDYGIVIKISSGDKTGTINGEVNI